MIKRLLLTGAAVAGVSVLSFADSRNSEAQTLSELLRKNYVQHADTKKYNPYFHDGWHEAHLSFNKDVDELLKKGCLPSFCTDTHDSMHGSYRFDTFVKRQKRADGGFDYLVKNWNDDSKQLLHDYQLGRIIPCSFTSR